MMLERKAQTIKQINKFWKLKRKRERKQNGQFETWANLTSLVGWFKISRKDDTNSNIRSSDPTQSSGYRLWQRKRKSALINQSDVGRLSSDKLFICTCERTLAMRRHGPRKSLVARRWKACWETNMVIRRESVFVVQTSNKIP